MQVRKQMAEGNSNGKQASVFADTAVIDPTAIAAATADGSAGAGAAAFPPRDANGAAGIPGQGEDAAAPADSGAGAAAAGGGGGTPRLRSGSGAQLASTSSKGAHVAQAAVSGSSQAPEAQDAAMDDAEDGAGAPAAGGLDAREADEVRLSCVEFIKASIPCTDRKGLDVFTLPLGGC